MRVARAYSETVAVVGRRVVTIMFTGPCQTPVAKLVALSQEYAVKDAAARPLVGPGRPAATGGHGGRGLWGRQRAVGAVGRHGQQVSRGRRRGQPAQPVGFRPDHGGRRGAREAAAAGGGGAGGRSGARDGGGALLVVVVVLTRRRRARRPLRLHWTYGDAYRGVGGGGGDAGVSDTGGGDGRKVGMPQEGT